LTKLLIVRSDVSDASILGKIGIGNQFHLLLLKRCESVISQTITFGRQYCNTFRT